MISSDKGLSKVRFAESYLGRRKLEEIMWRGAGAGENTIGANSQKVAFI